MAVCYKLLLSSVNSVYTIGRFPLTSSYISSRCAALSKFSLKLYSTDGGSDNESHIATSFVNRNPRNLEMMGIQWKRSGWKYQCPSREYYHRLIFERTNRYTTAYVEHCSGTKIITASTAELPIARHLYSSTDVSAARNIGRVLAQRCREAGIGCMLFHVLDNNEHSEKLLAFKSAVLEGGIELTEHDEKMADYSPGIDYDDDDAVNDVMRRQWLVYKQGEESAVKQYGKDHRWCVGRRRRRQRPTSLQQPSYSF